MSESRKRPAAKAIEAEEPAEAAAAGGAQAAKRGRKAKNQSQEETACLVLKEAFDQKAADFIIHEMTVDDLPDDMFKPMGAFAQKYGTTDRALLLQHLKDSVRGYVLSGGAVEYHYGEQWAKLRAGRLYAKHSSLQSFPRPIRALLADALFWDVDMVNAGPTITSQLAKKKGWTQARVQYYVDNRAKCLHHIQTDLGVDRDEAKNLVTAIFGGCGAKAVEGLHPYFKQLRAELSVMRDRCWEDEEYAALRAVAEARAKSEGGDPKATLFSIVIQTLEAQILGEMCAYATANGRHFGSLQYDGALLLKLLDEMALPEEFLRAMEEHVEEKLGYKVRLVVKPMETTIAVRPVTTCTPVADASAVTDLVAAETLRDRLGPELVRDHGELTAFNRRTGMWEKGTLVLRDLVFQNKEALVFRDPKGMACDYSGFDRQIQSLLRMLPSTLPDQRGYFQKQFFNDTGKLLFLDGIYDFNTDTFTPGFDSSAYFTARVPHKFADIDPRTATAQEKACVKTKLFEEPFEDRVGSETTTGDRLLRALVLGLIGEARFQAVVFLLGPTGSAKSLLLNLLETLLGSGNATRGSFGTFLHSKDKDPRREWLPFVDKVHARYVMFSEPQNGTDDKSAAHKVYLSTHMFCTVSSGGIDTISYTPLYESQERTTYTRALLLVAANDIPPLSESNDAARKRMLPIAYKYTFKDDPDPTKMEKKRDTALGDLLKTPRMLAALLAVFIDEYKAWCDEGKPLTIELSAAAEELRGDLVPCTDIRSMLERDFMLTADCKCSKFVPSSATDKPSHVTCPNKVKCSEIEDSLKQNGCNYSSNRIGREVVRMLGIHSSTKLGKDKARCGIRWLNHEERAARQAKG